MAVFTIKKWGGWAPGLDQPAHWAAWASGQMEIATVGEPKALSMPPMLRRRAGRHVRMAFEAAHACVQGEKNLPVVFCSRHGEVKRSLEILDPIARGEAVSPAAFSLSVHNAIAGLYSIALAESAPMTAIAGTADSAALGVIEACGQLAEGAAAVLLVVYDEPLPDLYRAFRDEPEAAYAWAWLMTAPDGPSYSLTSNDCTDDIAQASEPFGLQLMRGFLSGADTQRLASQNRTWCWSRHA